MKFDTDVANGNQLVIDSLKSTVTLIDNSNSKTNQMAYYNHQFPKIQNGTNTLLILSGINNESQVTVEWNDLVL